MPRVWCFRPRVPSKVLGSSPPATCRRKRAAAVDMSLHVDGVTGAAARWRGRRLRAAWWHEQLSVAMTVAAVSHHSAPRSERPGRHIPGQKTATEGGQRPGVLKDPGPLWVDAVWLLGLLSWWCRRCTATMVLTAPPPPPSWPRTSSCRRRRRRRMGGGSWRRRPSTRRACGSLRAELKVALKKKKKQEEEERRRKLEKEEEEDKKAKERLERAQANIDHASSLSKRKRKKKKRKKRFPRTSSFARAARPWKSGPIPRALPSCQSCPVSGYYCLRRSRGLDSLGDFFWPCFPFSARCFARQWLHVPTSVWWALELFAVSARRRTSASGHRHFGFLGDHFRENVVVFCALCLLVDTRLRVRLRSFHRI